MRERMELLGGSVEIESASPGGTTVTATIPLRERSLDGLGVIRSVLLRSTDELPWRPV